MTQQAVLVTSDGGILCSQRDLRSSAVERYISHVQTGAVK